MNAGLLKRLFAVIALLLILYAASVPVLYDHDCCGEDCGICFTIEGVKSGLTGTAIAALFIFSWNVFFDIGSVFYDNTEKNGETLVSLHVKLSD